MQKLRKRTTKAKRWNDLLFGITREEQGGGHPFLSKIPCRNNHYSVYFKRLSILEKKN
jgi:hypothetical protein